VREGWVTKPLGELCRIEIGGTPPRGVSKFWDEKKTTSNVWLSIADMPKTLHSRISSSAEHLSDEGAKRVKIVKAGTLLVSFKLTLGRLGYADIDLRTNEAIAALELFDEGLWNSEYLYWYLTFFDWQKAAEGEDKIKGKTLNKAKLAVLPVLVPPLLEQQRIVAILDEAFAGLATATANAEKNLKNARELFDSYVYFVFEQNWTTQALGDICENLDSKRIPVTKRDRKSGDIPYYGASGAVDYVDDFIFDEDLLLVSEDGANLVMRTYPIAFSIAGKSWVNNHAHVLRFPDLASQKFVEHYLNSISLTPYVNGMAQPKLNQKALNSIPVPWPKLDEREEAVARLEELDAQTEQLRERYEAKIMALTELKQSILQKAFSGELTSPPTQAIKEAAE
jgi:type I restriction enzyme S subunit